MAFALQISAAMRRRGTRQTWLTLALVVCSLAAGASAEPSGTRAVTAHDVADLPLAGAENGRVDPVDDGESTPRTIFRGLLFVPRYALDVALFPIRGSLWLSERHDGGDGGGHHSPRHVIPVFGYETSVGAFAGAALVHDDLLGARERLRLQASIGSHYHQRYLMTVSSGDRLGAAELELDAGYEHRPHDAFYGIGNADTIDAAQLAMPIDARVDATAVEARYRQDRAHVRLTADLRPVDHLHVRPSGELAHVSFGGDELAARYAPEGLVGFDGISYSYAELELRWDDRHTVDRMEPDALYTAGTLAAVYGGRVDRIDTGPAFYRYGADAAHFFRLARGPRVLIASLHGEAVTGARDEVPFSELPRLGGWSSLRGYDLDRFRDRVAASGALEYKWDLSQWVSASVFTDVGRVAPSLAALSVADLRMGYGVALEGHTLAHAVIELSAASSIDGGLFLNLAFDPTQHLDQPGRRP